MPIRERQGRLEISEKTDFSLSLSAVGGEAPFVTNPVPHSERTTNFGCDALASNPLKMFGKGAGTTFFKRLSRIPLNGYDKRNAQIQHRPSSC